MDPDRGSQREARVAAVAERAASAGAAGRFQRVPHRVAYALDRWPLEDAAVLDVGCSFGHALIHFGPGSVGLDNAPPAIDFCRSVGLAASLLDVERDPLDAVADAGFDFLWVSDVLEHVDAPRLLLRRLAPKLRDGGRLLLFVSVLPEIRSSRVLLRRIGMRPYDADVHFHQFTVATVTHLLERAGFRRTRLCVPVPRRFERLNALMPAAAAPRLLIEARRDSGLEATVVESERRNSGR